MQSTRSRAAPRSRRAWKRTFSDVIDLTGDDRPIKTEDTCIVISDDDGDAAAEQTSRARRRAPPLPGTIFCPVCMDGYAEIADSGRLLVSTLCGHVFCGQCLRDALRHSKRCPKCRKRVTHRQYHPIYV